MTIENLEKLSTQTIDEIQRIVIPNIAMSKLGWKERDLINMYCDNKDTLVLKRVDSTSETNRE